MPKKAQLQAGHGDTPYAIWARKGLERVPKPTTMWHHRVECHRLPSIAPASGCTYQVVGLGDCALHAAGTLHVRPKCIVG